jgi:hypothetical protein
VRQKDEYEDLLGRPIRVEKRFVGGSREILVPATRQDRRAAAFGRKLMCMRCWRFVNRRCSLGVSPWDARCVL